MATVASARRGKNTKATVTRPQPVRGSHGGRRAGAGRKPKGLVAGVPHDTRKAFDSRCPVQVTIKLREDLPPLRRRDAYQVLCSAFAAGCDRRGFRLVHYAVQNGHLHFVVEASSRTALSRGVQGLMVRIARTLNRLWQRRGPVFADRYLDRILRSPREVREALRFLLTNGQQPADDGRAGTGPKAIDPYTSAPWFEGFREPIVVRERQPDARPVAKARTWLLTIGWRRHGLLSLAAPQA